MARGKHKNRSKRNNGCLASSDPNSNTIPSPGYTITLEKQGSDLKSHIMMMLEDLKNDMNKSLKEIQENTGKKVEALKDETHTHTHTHTHTKSLKELQESITKQVKELNKTSQDLKMEI
jgi:septal ring factor EnvC (AmiA/AmiB activator)